MLNELLIVVSETLSVPLESLNVESSSENIDKWDSLAHMNLIFAVEDEFKVVVSDEELPDSMSVQKLLNIISKKS